MTKQEKNINKNWTSGIGLIGLGIFFLLMQSEAFSQFNSGILLFLLLTIGFVGGGIATKESGLFVPGGIFTGLTLGIWALESSLTQYVAEDGGLFMIGFALGWVSITLYTAVFQHKLILWPFIPASIMGFIGLAVSLGGLWITLLEIAGQGWPILLVILGIYMLWENSRSNKAGKSTQ